MKMVKLTKFLILAGGLAATAFSLERARISSPVNAKISAIRKSSSTPVVQQQSTTCLLAALEASANSANVVAIAPAAPAPEKTLLSTIWNEQTKLAVYLAIWYSGNIYYNIYNKKACIALGKNAHGGSNLHWALAATQLFVGVLLVLPLWITGLRKSPDMTVENWKELAPVGLWASLSHAFSVLSMAVGAVSFGQIVKAGEPVFAAATNAILLKVCCGEVLCGNMLQF